MSPAAKAPPIKGRIMKQYLFVMSTKDTRLRRLNQSSSAAVETPGVALRLGHRIVLDLDAIAAQNRHAA
jgi:hypothetical protein